MWVCLRVRLFQTKKRKETENGKKQQNHRWEFLWIQANCEMYLKTSVLCEIQIRSKQNNVLKKKKPKSIVSHSPWIIHKKLAKIQSSSSNKKEKRKKEAEKSLFGNTKLKQINIHTKEVTTPPNCEKRESKSIFAINTVYEMGIKSHHIQHTAKHVAKRYKHKSPSAEPSQARRKWREENSRKKDRKKKFILKKSELKRNQQQC